MTHWTTDEDDLLRQLYPDVAIGDLERVFEGRTRSSIRNRAYALSLKRSTAFFTSEGSGRIMPANIPWNAGMKGLQIGGVTTRFKKGHRGGKAAALWVPVGSERITKDGICQRKIHDSMPFHTRWRAVHSIVWELLHGATIPPGHLVIFRDGNRGNFSCANLELVSRRENMQRNSVHNYPAEIAHAMLLRGQLTRKINERSKQK
ncbi:HNH endonuclease signature motif containing protein [Methylobacillus pratensis]